MDEESAFWADQYKGDSHDGAEKAAAALTPGFSAFKEFYLEQSLADIHKVTLEEVKHLPWVRCMFSLLAEHKKQQYLSHLRILQKPIGKDGGR